MFVYVKAFLGPRTYFILKFGLVALFSQSMSLWRAMATHFGPETVIFELPQNANICYWTPKILILGLCMYCKQRNLYCKYKYLPQRYRLYVSNIQILCFKNTNSTLQIHNLYVVYIDFLCRKYTCCTCQK